jgi:RND superfamily putative drug exporter
MDPDRLGRRLQVPAVRIRGSLQALVLAMAVAAAIVAVPYGARAALQIAGLSLASAVFLDAFVVRSLLLPSVLTLLGRRTWSLPRGLDRRLPRIALEAPSVAVPSSGSG